jgi:hypothetical protein
MVLALTDSAGAKTKIPGVSFSEIGQLAGVSNTDWSWASLFADFNNDGYQDLFVSNGYARDYTNMDFLSFAANEKMKEEQENKKMTVQQIIEKMPSAIVKNYIFENNGQLNFSKRTDEWGLDQPGLSNGAAYADLDNDGDLDLVVNNINEEAFVYRNNAEVKVKENGFLKVKLAGLGKNKNGIGAKVQVTCSDKTLFQEMMPTRGFQSSVPHELIFGIGKSTIKSLKITWPDGNVQTLPIDKANQTITLKEEAATRLLPTSRKHFPLFTQES